MSEPVEKDYVHIFDTTLRDGEQSPGATMTVDEKIRIARKLELLGVDVIEAGFPIASEGEVVAVQRISAAVTECEVAGLCRTRSGDIETAWRAVQEASKPRLHVFIATSSIHLKYKLKMTEREVLEEIRRGVSQCRSLCNSVEFSAEDATRSDIGFLKEAFACAIENGATVINIPDTVGYTMPQEYTEIVTAIREHINDPRIVISAHCHDDLGLAVANSLAAVAAGARQVECCINGIGERAGNASLEEVVMALRTRRDLVGVDTRVNTQHLVSASHLVADTTGMPVQPNKAVVGRNAFAHEAGIHQHGVLHERTTYEIMRPEDVGLTESKIVLGKHSGRHALRDRLKTLGYPFLDAAEIERVFHAFKALADRKKRIYDEDLHSLIADEVLTIPQHYNLVDVTFRSGSHTEPWAKVQLEIQGREVEGEGTGDGPVDAVFAAIRKCTGKEEVVLEDYALAAISGGSDAQGRVSLSILEEGAIARGQATHTDVVVASARAFVAALNHQVYQAEVCRLSAARRAI